MSKIEGLNSLVIVISMFFGVTGFSTLENWLRMAAAFNLVAKLPSALGVLRSNSLPASLVMYSSLTSSIPLKVGVIYLQRLS